MQRGPSVTFESCPDEILRLIVRQLGPYLTSYRRNEYWGIYDLDIGTLKRLRLVNKRLRCLAEAELFRAPHVVFAHRGDYLLSDHVNIWPKAAVHAEALWVLGSAAFFARLFSMGFGSLTWLDLMFEIPGRSHASRFGAFDITDSASTAKLVTVLQGMQLRYLKVYYQSTLTLDFKDATQSIHIATGHLTLQDFIWCGPSRPEGSQISSIEPLENIKVTRNLRSFHCENVTDAELSWIFASLGDLPELRELRLARRYCSSALQAVPDEIAAQLTQLVLFGTYPDPIQLSSLASLSRFQNLEVLAFGDILENAGMDASLLENVYLPCLKYLESTSELAFQTNIALFRWAQNTDLLPRLQTLHVRREGTGASLSWPEMAEAADMGTILNELLAARQDIQLTPVKIRQRMENRLRRYRAFQANDTVE